MAAIDINKLINDIKTSTSTIAGKDVTTIGGFSASQISMIANQTSLVAHGIVTGEITAATRTFFLDQLVELAKNFAQTLVGLIMVTIEKIWNAIVSILYATISSVTGLAL